MTERGTVVVAGASGVIGASAVRGFAAAGWPTVGVSRRAPDDLAGAQHVAIDLTDGDATRVHLGGLGATTHLVFAALQESPGLVPGWTDRDLMQRNLTMFTNTIDPLLDAGHLRHVSLLQGTKAYGVHLGPQSIPCKEDRPRVEHDNFYFWQEDALRERADARGFGFTVVRPQIVFGDSIASPMNVIPVLGAYGALLRERGLPLAWPGGVAHVSEAIDADLLAEVLVWAATNDEARDEIFNVANGDVFVWQEVWPAIADALGMAVGDPAPLSLVDEFTRSDDEWAAIVAHHQLRSPQSLAAFVGQSPIYADMMFGLGAPPPSPIPTLVSTVKLRQAGFAGCIDTEDMFRRQLRRLQDRRLLPTPLTTAQRFLR